MSTTDLGPRGASGRPAVAEIDLGALAANVALLVDLVAPARVCCVVKADAYGHGAIGVAPSALTAGASMLAVALVEEGVALREAGISAPILVLSEPPPEAIAEAAAERLTLTLYTKEGIAAARRAGAALGRRVVAHLKVDTGMHRVGAPESELADLAAELDDAAEVDFAGLFTHLAVADEVDDPFTALQLAALARAADRLAAAGHRPPLIHAANSAGAIAHPGSRHDLVRCGISCYGYLPSEAVGAQLVAARPGARLSPVMALRSTVHYVRDLEAGARPSYGRRYALAGPGRVATVPIGYADGVPRVLGATGGEVLIGGRRRPIAGTVTMDQLMVDCGDDPAVRPGDEVVLIGQQGGAEITAEEWAQRTGTISYEILTGIGARVPRRYLAPREGGPGRDGAQEGCPAH